MVQPASKGSFNAVDITGAEYAKDFQLTDHTGKARSLGDFKGKVVLLFFGFTHCADICPTTLSDAAKAIKNLEGDGGRVQVLFVTVDPRRDTPEVLAKYVPAFNPGFLGLYGNEEATQKAAKDFRVFYQQRPVAESGGDYSMDHMGGTLVFDSRGRLRLFINYGMAADKIAADLRKLLTS